jgi:hypothetical protein
VSAAKSSLARLRARHAEFLLSRLTSESAREDWVQALRETWQQVLASPVRDLVEPQAAAGAVVRVLSEDSVRELYAPILRDAGRRALESARASETALGKHVPDGARRALEALAEHPSLVPDRLVREVLGQEAVEKALRDVLFDGLREFHDTVNPFFADWGIPSLLKWLPIGAGAVKASMGTLRAEFDKRLEPEIRKFLLVFSRRATTHLADVLLSRSNDPNLVALRRNVVVFLYSQSMRELLAGVDDGAATHVETAAEAVALQAVSSRELRASLQDMLARFVADHGAEPVGDWLARIGATAEPDFEAWVELAWPLLRRSLATSALRRMIERINAEFYDSLKD